jgi:hypothetical protein
MPHIRSPIENTQAVKYGLTVEFIWWILGVILVTGYFIFVYRSSREKLPWQSMWTVDSSALERIS